MSECWPARCLLVRSAGAQPSVSAHLDRRQEQSNPGLATRVGMTLGIFKAFPGPPGPVGPKDSYHAAAPPAGLSFQLLETQGGTHGLTKGQSGCTDVPLFWHAGGVLRLSWSLICILPTPAPTQTVGCGAGSTRGCWEVSWPYPVGLPRVCTPGQSPRGSCRPEGRGSYPSMGCWSSWPNCQCTGKMYML